MATYIKPGVYIQEYDMLFNVDITEKTTDFEKVAVKLFSDWLAEEIDNAIMDELFAEVERDKEIVKGIIPDRLFEV